MMIETVGLAIILVVLLAVMLGTIASVQYIARRGRRPRLPMAHEEDASINQTAPPNIYCLLVLPSRQMALGHYTR